MRKSLALIIAVAVAAAAPRAARAQEPDAVELKHQGDKAMAAHRYEEAIALYNQAYAQGKEAAILYNLGRAHEARGEYPEALAYLERFAREAPPETRARVPRLDELIADVRSKRALVSISCAVAGARVLVRDRAVGTCPLVEPVAVNAGRASIEAIAEGYIPFRRELDLKGGTTTVVELLLARKDRSGILTVATSPAGASVFIDGKRAGNSPVELVVDAGTHAIVARTDGYEESSTSAIVTAGERRSVDVPLARTAGITSKWWFWTGVGVLVVGGAVLTYALVTERKPDTGDKFQPGQAPAPLLRW